MLRRGYALDHNILNVINLVLKELPTDKEPIQLEREHIDDLLLGLPKPEDILKPSNFA